MPALGHNDFSDLKLPFPFIPVNAPFGASSKAASDLKSVTKEGWFCWNVQEDVGIFVNTPDENFGWFLKSAATTGSDETAIAFYSRNALRSDLRPYLYIRYTVGGSGPIGLSR